MATVNYRQKRVLATIVEEKKEELLPMGGNGDRSHERAGREGANWEDFLLSAYFGCLLHQWRVGQDCCWFRLWSLFVKTGTLIGPSINKDPYFPFQHG
jgi:hypothetical protein